MTMTPRSINATGKTRRNTVLDDWEEVCSVTFLGFCVDVGGKSLRCRSKSRTAIEHRHGMPEQTGKGS